MTLNDDQKDAVTELVNIAFSRTAAALSELTGNRVELAVPEVSAHPIRELMPALSRFVRGDVATVHQIFGGPVSGDAFLLLDIEGAARLVGLVAERVDWDSYPDDPDFVVLADPDGNRFCIVDLGHVPR